MQWVFPFLVLWLDMFSKHLPLVTFTWLIRCIEFEKNWLKQLIMGSCAICELEPCSIFQLSEMFLSEGFWYGTMLQKLSKCELKAWLCWNLIILPLLRFYVKSKFCEFKWSKNVIFGNFGDSEFWIFGTWTLL